MNDSIDLRQYFHLALKWWWLIILLAVAGAASAYIFSRRQEPVYQATATIMVGQSIQSTQLDTRDIYISQQLAQTYANIARRQPVLQSVVEALQLPDNWQTLRSRVTVNPVRDTQLLEITVEAGSPDEALVTADEVASQLIKLSPTALENQTQSKNQEFIRQRLDSLKGKIQAGQARLETLNQAMSGSLSAQQVQDLQEEINNLEQLVAGWENNYTQLLVLVEKEKSPNYLAVIEPAQTSGRPVRPKTMQNTLLGGVVGLLLALGIIFLLEYLDDTLKSPVDLEQQVGVTALGAIGRIKGKSYQDKLVTAHDLFSPQAEAYRMLRSNIQFMAIDEPVRAIMVTSPTPSEGKSTTVANLGVVMAQTGLKTIIIDADLRKPVQHDIFQVGNMAGLTDLLRTPEARPGSYLRQTTIENLRLMTSGKLPPNPSEMLGSRRMQQLVSDLLAEADVILFDSPPVLAVADAPVLASHLDGVVLVTEAGATRRDAARQAVANLQHAGATILGAVVNQFSKSGGGYYYYYHHYYHSGNGHGPQGSAATPQRQGKWLPFLK
mgnify:CR=1 FL=1